MHRPGIHSERGAVFIHVAIALLFLLAISAFVIDYGMFWVSRSQAQRSADAGALAGAVSIARDRANDGGVTAEGVAFNTAAANAVWGATPGVVAESPYDGAPCGTAGQNACVRVDTYRDGSNGSSLLPTWFANLFGLAGQGVRAMAVARAGIGDTTTCLKPWAIVDKWQEFQPSAAEWTPTSIYNKYLETGPDAGTVDPSLVPPDNYVPPSPTATGTGFHPFNSDGSYTSDYGRQLTLKSGDNNDFQFGSGWFKALSLPNPDCSAGGMNGKDCYRENIKGCVGIPFSIGDTVEVENSPGEAVGPTVQGVAPVEDGGDTDSIVAQDPDAYWDPTLYGGRGGVTGSDFASSPRIVAVPLVNPDTLAEVQKGGRSTVTIMNIAGFFVEGMAADGKGVVGRLVTMPSLQSSGTGPISEESAYLYVIQLVR